MGAHDVININHIFFADISGSFVLHGITKEKERSDMIIANAQFHNSLSHHFEGFVYFVRTETH
jgi:hypothetical protein